MITPGFSPPVGQADAPDNALMTSQATIAPVDFTTLAIQALTDQISISTVLAPVVDSWYLLRSTSLQTGYPGLTFGTNIVRGEPVRIRSVAGAGPFTVTLYSPVEQCHGVGSGLRLMVPIEDLVVTGVEFRMAGGTIANGIYIVGAVDVVLDVSGSGASRALVELLFCKSIQGRVRNLGENNSPLLCGSSHRCVLEHDYQESTELGFAHANGIPRGVQYTAVSMHTEVNGRIGHCTSLEFKGLGESVFNCRCENLDFTERALRDPNLFLSGANVVGACVMNCSNPASLEYEVPVSVSGSLYLENCSVPDPTTNGLQWGALFVDTIKFDIDSLSIVNDGRPPGSNIRGFCLYDTAAFDCIRMAHVLTIGVETALTLYGGGNRAEIGRWDATTIASTTGGVLFIAFGNQGAGFFPLHVEHLVLNDAPAHFTIDHPGTTAAAINHDSLRDIVFDKIDILNLGAFEDVRICLDVEGLADFAGQMGDVVEICPPRAVTLANATDTFTLAGHDFPDGTPIYLGGTTMPTGYAAGTILYVRDSNRATLNTTFRTSLTLGGAVFTGFTSDGVGLTVNPSYRTTRLSTTTAASTKGARMNGVGFGAGVALPVRHYATAFGEKKLVRFGAVQVLNGDSIDPVIGALTGVVNNASTDPIGIAEGKPSLAAGNSRVS